MDLSNGPLVLKVPAIKDRYYTFEFLDAYTNVYSYVGTRATGSSGGTYLIAGPEWNGEVPNGMTMIWSPTNLAWILQRTLLKGPNDIGNVHAIQDQMNLAPLSGGSQGNASEQGSAMNVTNASWALYPELRSYQQNCNKILFHLSRNLYPPQVSRYLMKLEQP